MVATATLGSRMLALLRDILIFALLGAGALNSAFLIAFTLPNLFRRLLGEGALTSAFVPVLTEASETDGRPGGFAFLNKVVTRLSVLLLLLVGVLVGLYALVAALPLDSERWQLGVRMGPVLAPYLAFVCLAAVLGAALNVLGRFSLAALSAVWLNLSMIVALGGIGYWVTDSPSALAGWLCGGVLVGGVIQVALPAIALIGHGWHPRIDRRGSDRLRELHRLFLPGLLGAGIVQINIAVSRLLAFAVDEQAVAQLYLANRLVELPMGLFAIAITTVAFPRLARFQAQGDQEGLRTAFGEGVRLILTLTVPAALGLLLLREPILRLLFEWGRFDASDVTATARLLAVFALTVPFYSLTAYLTRVFHAMKDTRFPVRTAAVAFFVNTLLSLVLMQTLGALGLALANLGSVLVQTTTLGFGLRARMPSLRGAVRPLALVPLLVASVGLGLFVAGGWELLHVWIEAPKLAALAAVAGLIPLAALLYFVVLLALSKTTRESLRAALPDRHRPSGKAPTQ